MSSEMVEKFLCPGCVVGSDTGCGAYRPQFANSRQGSGCGSHTLGTFVMGIGSVALGLPRGFNRPGVTWDSRGEMKSENKMEVRLYSKAAIADGDRPLWNTFNVASWAMVADGYLFVRTHSPRTNRTYVDIIEGGDFSMLPKGTVDVGKFIDEID